MDHLAVQTTPSIEEDEWDTDGYAIPSLEIKGTVEEKADIPKAEEVKESDVQDLQAVKEDEEHIYLGPHGAPPSQPKQLEQKNTSSRKHKFKQKLKEADQRYNGSGRENRVDSIKELVGHEKGPSIASKSSSRDWLDPHCHESEFERRPMH